MNGIVTRVVPVLATVNALFLTGCFTLAKQAFHEARGAQGDVLLINDVGERALARYQGVEFTPATTTVGRQNCPPELLAAYDRSVRETLLRLKPLYPGGQPGLTADSEIIYFQKKGLLGGAFMLTRVKMQSGGQLAVDALVRAESEAFRAGGENDLARASADALEKFLRKHKQPERPPPAGRRGVGVTLRGRFRPLWPGGAWPRGDSSRH